MEAWKLELYRNELYHHGIKGQQWGVNNGPPYPLDAKTHRQVVRSAGKQVRKSAEQKEDVRRTTGRIVGRSVGTMAGTTAGMIGGAVLLGALGAPVAVASVVATGATAVAALLGVGVGVKNVSDMVGLGMRTQKRVDDLVEKTMKEMGSVSVDDFVKAANNKNK